MRGRGPDQNTKQKRTGQVHGQRTGREVAGQARRYGRVETKARYRAERAAQGDARPGEHTYQCRPQRASMTPATASVMPATMLAAG